MNIDSIKNGIVIDHITAGRSMKIYRLLGLESLDCSDTDILGYVDPGVTVNIIRDGKIAEKRTLELPTELTDVLKCKNPRCITSTEQELPHIFRLTDREHRVYRCIYCETKGK